MEGLKFMPKFRKIVAYLVVSMMFSLMWMLYPGMAAATPATSLTLKVGYSGGTYTTARTFSAADLSNMTQVAQAYTYINNYPEVVIDSVYGVKLTDLLASANIDVNSIQGFSFDSTDNYTTDFTESALLGTARYYYPNLPTDNTNGVPTTGADTGAVPVVPVMAEQDNWQPLATTPDFTDVNGDNAYRLEFGQSSTSDQEASHSAYWVQEIDVTLSGTPVTSISLNKTVDTVVYGNTDTLVATVLPSTANQTVTWSSDNTAVATVSSTGVVTPVENGTAVITATTADELTATCDVTVTGATASGPTTFMTIKVNGTSFIVTAAQILALNPTNTLSYFSDNKGYSTCLGAPFAQILSRYTSLTSSEAQSVSATIYGSDYSSDGFFVNVPESTLTATRYYYPSTGGPAVQVAPIIAVEEADSATSAITDPTQLNSSECLRNFYGQAYVGDSTARNFDRNIEEIDVTYVPVTSVSLVKTSDTIALGGIDTLSTVIAPATATNQSLTWASSSPGVATVDQTGKVTAVTPGTTDITATTQDGSNITSAPCVVNVPLPAIAITGVVLSKTSDTIVAGGSDQLTAMITPGNASYQSLLWASSKPGVATVDQTGKVTGVTSGTTNITAATQDGSNITTTPGVVTVQTANPGSVTGVSLNKTTDTVKYGTTDTLVATVAPATATDQNVTWSSDNTAVATVGSAGVVTPVHWGTANITATTQDGDFKASCAVTVIGGPTASLAITVNGGAPVTVTAAQISALTSAGTLIDYSATGSGGTSLYFTTAGAPLAQILTAYAGVPSSEAQNVSATFIGSDNYTVSLTASQLFATRYYYPVSGSPVQVAPIIATAEADDITTDPSQLNPSECLRNFYGQASPTEHTSNNLDQNLKEIDVTYAGPSVVSSINPSTGPEAGGTPLTLSGYNLSVVSAVYFGTVPDTSFTTNTAGTQIITTSPSGTGTVDVAVYSTVYGLSSTFAPFTYNSQSPGGGGGGAVSYTPAVQTEAASTVAADSAVLNGDISSDNGYGITDYGFLWGASSSSLTNKLDVGTDNHSGAFTATLSSLPAGTTYCFQAYATNSYGTADGSVLSFTTTGGSQTATPTAPVFFDVPSSYWAYDAISSLGGKSIVSGYPDGTFKPDATITRTEFATMLVKALGLNTTGTTGQFTDVTADSWYYGSVNAAALAGLVSGTGDNLFAPNALITREQMAVMVTKALGDKAPATDGTELNAFSDRSAVSSWAVTGMEEAVKAGIVSGMTADTLAPQADATRVQAAVMIYKMLIVLGK